MKTLDAITALIPTLAGRISTDATASQMQAVVEGLGDAEAVAVLREAGEVGRLVEQVQVICAGVIARRSTRDAGHTGLAQARGHRSATSLIQELGGMSNNEAARQYASAKHCSTTRATHPGLMPTHPVLVPTHPMFPHRNSPPPGTGNRCCETDYGLVP